MAPAECGAEERFGQFVGLAAEERELHDRVYPRRGILHVPIEIVNCSEDVLRLHSLSLLFGDGAGSGYEWEANDPRARIPRRSKFRIWLPTHDPRKLGIRASGDLADAPWTSELLVVEAIDDGIVEARAACQACNGVWGRVGRSGHGCICRTSDAGKRCDDGLDCEGECIATGGFEVVEPAARTPCPAGAGCQSRPALGYALGRCSEYKFSFGCRPRIEEGARLGPPRPKREAVPVKASCID